MKRCYNNLHTFIYKLVKDKNPRCNITNDSKDILNDLIQHIAKTIIIQTVALCRYAKKITIEFSGVETAVRLRAPIDLTFAHKVLHNYTQNNARGMKKHERAGLHLPVSRIEDTFREYKLSAQKLGETSYVFLTAILEMILSDIIDNCNTQIAEAGVLTIRTQHVFASLGAYRRIIGNYHVAGFGNV